MKDFIVKVLSVFGVESVRTKNITKHVMFSALYKGGSILATFLLVPLSIKFLDTENYGIWLTLSSFIAWFSFFDIGLGNGLRNKFAEAKAKGNLTLAKGYVSTAYYTILSICLIFLIFSIVASSFISWHKVFNGSVQLEDQLQVLMPIVFTCFSFQLTLKLITSIYIADQNHSMQGKIDFIIATTSLLVIWVLTKTNNSSLLLFGAFFSMIPVCVLLILNFFAFSNRYREFRPHRSYWNKTYFKDIFGLGIAFFVIQISAIVLFTTDNFIITQILGPEQVVPYNIAYKYLGISSMLFVIVLTPYWSSITDAYAKGELDWIKKSMRNLIKFIGLAALLILVLLLISPFSYKIWVGDLVEIPFALTASMAFYYLVTIGFSPFAFFINGVGKIRLQMYSVAAGAILNIPLSIFLMKYTELGSEGVIIATVICVIPNLILLPLQYLKIINKTATGLWNK